MTGRTTKDTPSQLLSQLCPWTKELPDRLQRQLLWETTTPQPDDLQGPTALILYAGVSLKSAMQSLSKNWPMTIWEIDNKCLEKEVSDDMLLGEPYGTLCRGAIQGHIRLIGGGPNCRTWSILRWFPKPGAPVPVRDRSTSNTWGLPELSDQDNDSLLLLRYLVILVLAHKGAKRQGASPPASFLERPEDPAQCSSSPSAHRCSSIWAIGWLRNLLQALGLTLIHFDQCRLGQCTPKPTTLATNLDLGIGNNWDATMRHTRDLKVPLLQTSVAIPATWCRDWPEPSSNRTPPKRRSPNYNQPARQTDPCHKLNHPRWPWMMTQFESKWASVSGASEMEEANHHRGAFPRHLEGILHVEIFARNLQPSAIEDFTSSIHSGNKTHPFSTHLLRELRDKLASYCTITGDPHNIDPGQPFHLDLIGDLAQRLQDPDWEYPKIPKDGVPLGVTSPTLRTPGIWPTKEELRGEEDPYPEHPPLQGRDNYPSAKEFTKEIEATFEEEKRMGMVLGPFAQQEAATICGCQPDQLCPGPMAGIQESDKVRTIFDGSWGGANTHIQSNTVERTTAPTVMDCV